MKKGIIFLLNLILCSVLLASFEVAPSIQVIDLNKPLTRQFHLKNNTNKLVKIKVYPERPKNQKSEEFYMGDWVVIYPKIVYLKPTEKKWVRFGVRKPEGFDKLSDGEYRTLIVFEQMENKTYSTTGEEEDANPSVGLQILQKMMISLYGNKGEIKYKIQLEKLRVENIEGENFIMGNIVNIGNATIDPVLKVTFNSNDKVLEEIDQPYPKVIRENSKELKVKVKKIPKKANRIKVEIFEAGGEKLAEKTIIL